LRLDKETSSLAAALRNNKIRGAWGEAQLKNIVQSAGLLEHVDFDTQVVVNGEDGKTLRPDMVVHLPGNKNIPIDAKVPYSDFQRAQEIPDTASQEELKLRKQLLEAHAKAMRDHIRALGDKQYWNLFEVSPDFVIAFIPNDALLQVAMEEDPTIVDFAFNHKVALASPITLWTVLKSIAYAWQQQSLTEEAEQLYKLSKDLLSRFATLGKYATGLGKSIAKSVQEYNKFVSTLESRVLVTARKFEKIDPTNLIAEVDLISDDKANVKELSAPELLDDGI
ncbi:MAG: DNA recombination protein RmuC, partial [Bifidobacteriaceae bacterium]|nr:DNA recombination protein RmuC [Bifidobacteriaceae bacterium]